MCLTDKRLLMYVSVLHTIIIVIIVVDIIAAIERASSDKTK
jgi:hypothetical protein